MAGTQPNVRTIRARAYWQCPRRPVYASSGRVLRAAPSQTEPRAVGQQLARARSGWQGGGRSPTDKLGPGSRVVPELPCRLQHSVRGGNDCYTLIYFILKWDCAARNTL